MGSLLLNASRHVFLAHFANRWFAYFTHLTYLGLCAYFFASGLQTTVYAWGDNHRYLLRTWPRFLQIVHEFLWSNVMSFSPLVTLVYWGLLNPPLPTFAAALVSISMHALNSVFCTFEVFCTNTPAPIWWYAVPCDAVLALYCGMNYIFATPELLGFYGMIVHCGYSSLIVHGCSLFIPRSGCPGQLDCSVHFRYR